MRYPSTLYFRFWASTGLIWEYILFDSQHQSFISTLLPFRTDYIYTSVTLGSDCGWNTQYQPYMTQFLENVNMCGMNSNQEITCVNCTVLIFRRLFRDNCGVLWHVLGMYKNLTL